MRLHGALLALLAVPAQAAQAPERACEVEDRSPRREPPRSCCTAEFIEEIEDARLRTLSFIDRARRRLSRPRREEKALWDVFGLKPNDEDRVEAVRRQLSAMWSAARAKDVVFLCRDRGDSFCRGRISASDNCPSTRPRRVWLCGNLESAPPFLAGDGWVRVLLREYAHIACASAGAILSEEREYRRGQHGFPPVDPEAAIRNADSYVEFILAE